MSAFLASLSKGWVMQNINSSANGENWSAAGPRQLRFTAMHRWCVQDIVQALPLSIHTSLFLFSAGLVIYLRDDSVGLRSTAMLLVVAMIVIYFAISFLPFLPSHSPFDTPLSIFIRSFIPKDRLVRDPVVKAQAVAWLLKTSADEDVIQDSVQAIAGLHIRADIQAALLEQDSVARTLFGGFSECMKTRDLTQLPSYLHAIRHLVQPECPPDSDVVSLFFDPLDKLDVLERGIYEYALLVKACILLRSKEKRPDLTELLDTAIPILWKCSGDPIKARLSRVESYDGAYVSNGKRPFAYPFLDPRENMTPKFGIESLKEGLRSAAIIRKQYAHSLGKLVKHGKQLPFFFIHLLIVPLKMVFGSSLSRVRAFRRLIISNISRVTHLGRKSYSN